MALTLSGSPDPGPLAGGDRAVMWQERGQTTKAVAGQGPSPRFDERIGQGISQRQAARFSKQTSKMN